MNVITGAAAVGAAVGGLWLWGRLRGWEPTADRVGDGVARTGIDATNRVSKFAEDALPVVGTAVSDAVRVTGELTAKSVGSSINIVDDAASRVIPGRRAHESAGAVDAGEAAATEAAAPAKKRTAKPRTTKKAATTGGRSTASG